MAWGRRSPQGRPLHLEELSVLARARRPASRWGWGEQAGLQGHPATCNSSSPERCRTWAPAAASSRGRAGARLPSAHAGGTLASSTHQPVATGLRQSLYGSWGLPFSLVLSHCSGPQDWGEDSRRTTHVLLQQGAEKGTNIPILWELRVQVSTSLQGSLEGAGVLGGGMGTET